MHRTRCVKTPSHRGHTGGGSAAKRHFPSERAPHCSNPKRISLHGSTSSSAPFSSNIRLRLCVCVCVSVSVNWSLNRPFCFDISFILKISRILCAFSLWLPVWYDLLCSAWQSHSRLAEKIGQMQKQLLQSVRWPQRPAPPQWAVWTVRSDYGCRMETGSAPRLFAARPHPVFLAVKFPKFSRDIQLNYLLISR